jgi:hypothetical protein
MTEILHRLNPAVPRGVLAPLAALMWGAVGLMLVTRAVIWFSAGFDRAALISLAVGLIMAGGMIPGMFVKIVRKNLARLALRPDRACLFSVFGWRSWFLVIVMSVGGVALRKSGVPRMFLAGPYLGMGLCLLSGAALYLASMRLKSNADTLQ